MENLTIEQKAHDLTVAYVLHVSSQNPTIVEPDDFVQEYNNAYDTILRAVKQNG